MHVIHRRRKRSTSRTTRAFHRVVGAAEVPQTAAGPIILISRYLISIVIIVLLIFCLNMDRQLRPLALHVAFFVHRVLNFFRGTLGDGTRR